MRFVGALLTAVVLVAFVFWVGSQIAISVMQPEKQSAEFLRGQTMDLCGYEVDTRHARSGYDLGEWRGDRCDELSELDHCLLECLSTAASLEAGARCFDGCVDH